MSEAASVVDDSESQSQEESGSAQPREEPYIGSAELLSIVENSNCDSDDSVEFDVTKLPMGHKTRWVV